MNVVYENGFYNEEVKIKFLEKVNNNASIKRIFLASTPLEKFYEKDLYDFNREELRRLFYVLSPKKINASKQNGRLVSAYLEWAIEEGYRKSVNPLLSVNKDWYKEFVNTGKMYFTEDELQHFISKCRNAQDAVIISLRMEGVRGEASSELLNLKITDVDETNNKLLLTNSYGDKRELVVSDQCIKLCIAAYNQQTYLKKNGAYAKQTKSTMTNLVQNEYVIRSSITRTDNFREAEKHLIHRRLKVLADYFNEPNLTPTAITNSGMLIMARDIYLEKQRLDLEDYDLIFERFGYKFMEDNTRYNLLSRLREEFLNVEKIKELYNL